MTEEERLKILETLSKGGMTVGQLIVENSGTINYNDYRSAERKPESFTDEQVARAIEAICGKGNVLNEKRLWAAVYWCLRWYCNFPVKGSDFCERVMKLPFSRKLEPECCYDNIRRLVTLSFMSEDARHLESVKPGKADETFFTECRTVVVALAAELEKTAVPTM